jgi:hypothetical protein
MCAGLPYPLGVRTPLAVNFIEKFLYVGYPFTAIFGDSSAGTIIMLVSKEKTYHWKQNANYSNFAPNGAHVRICIFVVVEFDPAEVV